MEDETEQAPLDPRTAAVQRVLEKLASLSPEETRLLADYMAPGVQTAKGATARLRNAALQLSKARTVVMLSGGLDSVAMLYLMLKQEQGLPLHVHHVGLYGWESDTKPVAEALACRHVVDYLWDQGYRFEYSESEMRFEYSAFDQMLYYFQAACLAASMPRVVRVAVGRVKNDQLSIGSDKFRVHPTTAGVEVFQTILKHWPLYATSAEIVYPLVDYEKRQIVNSLPPELLRLVCSCRQPVLLGTDQWENCGTCWKCRQGPPV